VFDTSTGVVNLTLVIIDNDGQPNPCAITQQAFFPNAVNGMSFYNVPCDGSGFVMSWGYDQQTDGAIMTLCG
jgi:hypothetical protein